MPLGQKFDQIEELNIQNKNKTLLSRYSIVLEDFKVKYYNYHSLEGCI